MVLVTYSDGNNGPYEVEVADELVDEFKREHGIIETHDTSLNATDTTPNNDSSNGVITDNNPLKGSVV